MLPAALFKKNICAYVCVGAVILCFVVAMGGQSSQPDDSLSSKSKTFKTENQV